MTEVKLGANCWNQYTTWADLREAGVRADRLGFDSVWTWDHLYPIVGDHEGPILEAYMVLAAWAEATERATLGLMVGANTFRNPAIVAKQITALDHISNGRAVLGIGGAWFETEHEGLGIEFGHSPGERLNWLDEAVQILRGMLDGTRPSGSKFYNADRRPQPSAPGPVSICRSSSAEAGSGRRCGPSRSTPTPAMSAALPRASSARTRSCAGTARRSAATSRRSSERSGSARRSSATPPTRHATSSPRCSRPTAGRSRGAISRSARSTTSSST